MKKTAYLLALAMFLTLSCQKNESRDDDIPENHRHFRTLSIGIADGQETKVGFDENKAFYWHKGDKVDVLTTAGFKEMTLDDSYEECLQEISRKRSGTMWFIRPPCHGGRSADI